MAVGVQIQVQGLDQLRRRLDPDLAAPLLRRFFQKATVLVQGAARRLAPVDTGRLRSSITATVDPGRLPGWGQVGTSVFYAPFVHDGTRPHFPPPQALEAWGRRHGGVPGFLVARAISRRGTRPRRFLTDAFNQQLGRVRRLVDELANDLQQAMGGR